MSEICDLSLVFTSLNEHYGFVGRAGDDAICSSLARTDIQGRNRGRGWKVLLEQGQGDLNPWLPEA